MKRILVIDDDELTLDVLKRILEMEGYEVITALNGEIGMEAFHQNHIDLVITDLVMPVKDGLRTIMELKKEKQDLPIIAISAGGVISKERYLTTARYLGNIIALPKPFKREDIVDTVKNLIQPTNFPDALEI
jgi:DNA-binding response OmpR family regulator